MIIEDSREKIKRAGEWLRANERDFWVIGLVALSAFLFYGLGRLSKIEESKPPITISSGVIATDTIRVLNTSAQSNPQPKEGRITASKSGTKYYMPWCNSNNIKAANRIYFTTETQAEQAGYTRAANCKNI